MYATDATPCCHNLVRLLVLFITSFELYKVNNDDEQILIKHTFVPQLFNDS